VSLQSHWRCTDYESEEQRDERNGETGFEREGNARVHDYNKVNDERLGLCQQEYELRSVVATRKVVETIRGGV